MSDSDSESTKPTAIYLVCYDGSAKSKLTLEFIKKHARTDSRIYLLGMTEAVESYKSKPSAIVSGSFAAPSAADAAILEEKKLRAADVSTRLLAARQELIDANTGLTDANIKDLVVETFDVRETVVEIAAKYKVDTVVVGSRGHGAIKRAVLGSLSAHLVHSFDGNVVVCRGD